MPERPILIRLDEVALLNVDNRTRENLCAEAAAVLRQLMAASERLAEKTRNLTDPQPSDTPPSGTDWSELYWLATDVRATLARLKGDG